MILEKRYSESGIVYLSSASLYLDVTNLAIFAIINYCDVSGESLG